MAILSSFVIEALCLALLGGVLGCIFGILAVNFALSGITGTTNFSTFSEVVFAFRLTPKLLIMGIVFSFFVGLLGGILPASRAAFTKITLALRQAG
ncbi:MAG: FtsX-like permease family protein [Thermodesulfobacteriota bacterium]